MNVLDRDFAAVQIRVFQADLDQSTFVDVELWKKRSLIQKIMDCMSALFDPVL